MMMIEYILNKEEIFMKKKLVGCICLAAVVSLTCAVTAACAKTSVPTAAARNSQVVPSGKTSSSTGMDSNEKVFKEEGFTDSDRRDAAKLSGQPSAKNVSAESNKELIYDRMLNTGEFYKTVTGKYRRVCKYPNQDYTVEYQVVNGPAHLSFEICKEAGNAQTVSYFDGSSSRTMAINDQIRATNSGQAAMVHNFPANPDAEKLDFVPLIKSTSRIKKDSSGINTYYYRQDLNMLYYSRECLTPQEMAFGYLSNFKTWKIVGEQTIAKRNCCQIQGTLSGEYAKKLHTDSYTLWVDSETGFLLKYKNYDQNGRETDSLETLQISVNPNLQPAELESAAKKYMP